MEITSLAQLAFLEDMLLYNVIMDSDSYKVSHHMQYPPGTEYVYSYLESRGGYTDKTVFYGLQYIIDRYMTGVVVTDEMIDVAKAMIVPHMGGDPALFNEEGWRYIDKEHGGRLPLLIKAIPEGTRIGVHNALVTVVNTDPKCFWLVNYMETMLMRVWYPISVATLSAELRDIIMEYLVLSGDPAGIAFKLQDFGSRGSTSRESAAIGSSAHGVSFMGSDTMIGMPLVLKHYRNDTVPFYSVPASEHSTITSWGKENESAAYANMLQKYPKGIVSIVSDSFDIFNACGELFGRELKAKIVNRDGTVVIRPDSGEIIPTILKCLDILGERFGYDINAKGYKLLPNCVRLLQGDGMNIHSVRALCRAIVEAGWSIDNIACFGMGGKLLQGVDRDTHKFAFKCSAICIDGKWHDVYKDPVGDHGKASKRGLMYVGYDGTDFHTSTLLESEVFKSEFGDHLTEVFRDGTLTKRYDYSEVRANRLKENYSTRVVGAASNKE